MEKTINIVLILKSGGDFKMSDVYLLTSHINRYWGLSKRPNIYCYTDLVSEEKSVVGLTIRPLPNTSWPGWWSKMNLFSPELQSLRPFLYMDLDTAIINKLNPIVPPNDMQSNFVGLRDFYRPNHFASGVMWIPDAIRTDYIFTKWLENPELNMKRFKGDQNFIESVIKAPDIYWQDVLGDFITTFKPNRQWRMEIPTTSSVVCFHGEPRIPSAALKVEWVKNYLSYAI